MALKEQIKEELERMENAGVVVKQTEQTDWVNSMVTVRLGQQHGDSNNSLRKYECVSIQEI